MIFIGIIIGLIIALVSAWVFINGINRNFKKKGD
jgi:preprotein translocase subunit SecD